MSDHHPAMQYAQYHIREKVTITQELLLSPTELQALSRTLPQVSLRKEYELQASYEDWKRQTAEAEHRRTEHKAKASAEDAAATPRQTTANVSAGSFVAPLPPTMTRSTTAEDAAASREFAVIEMMAETKESKDVCVFYLESTNWDLAAAVELLHTLQGR